VLDDRSYAQLRDELLARIPVYAPEWTDHHPSDPGVTLIELFAFLGEQLLYRFNQIPDATKLAFLDLLQVPLRPAVPATGTVRFTTTDAAGVLVAPTSRLLAGDVEVQTLDETVAWPVTARAAIRAAVQESLDADTAEYLARSAAAVGASVADVASYRTSFGAAEPMRPGGDVLDPAGSIDGTLYVALLAAAPPGADLSGMAGGVLNIGVVPAAEVPSMQARALTPCPGVDVAPPSPPMQWQVCTTTPVADAPVPDAADPVWTDLDVVGDSTGGLTHPGVVRLRLPVDLSSVGVYTPADPDALGAGDQPPLVDDPQTAATLAAWLRVFRPDGGDIPAVDWVDANVSRVEQASTARAEFLGTGTGDPTQERRLVHPGVLDDLLFDVEEHGTGRWVPWTTVADFRGSGVDDRHVVIDREAGTVRCGDGRRGRVWRAGERLRVQRYRYGGGSRGNLPPGAVSAAPDTAGVTVGNVLPLRGGADAEPLTDAVARIPEEFRRGDRAVTGGDFRELAEATPGAGVARAEVLPVFHPRTPAEPAPGVVSVVVWPAHDRARPAAPQPDRVLLDTVCRYLDQRRLVTTELHVLPPTYRRIAVSVGVAVRPGHGVESVRRWVEQVLRQLLSPLPPYGPDGRGWPLGRRVFAPELEAAALQVEGVEFLEPGTGGPPGSPCQVGLRLAQEQPDGSWAEPTDRTVVLEPWEVPELAAVSVVAGPPRPPGAGLLPPAPTGPAVPVRSPLEVCR
jgi:predicted phage baseplate assembly protein